MSLQVERAAALASAHGHLWAVMLTDDEWSLSVPPDGEKLTPPASWDERGETRPPRTRAEAEKGVALACALGWLLNPYPGIEFWVSPKGEINHETGTGRIRWTVSPSGETRIEIRRPGPRPVDPSDCVAVAVFPPIRGAKPEITLRYPGTSRVAARHLRALTACLEAIEEPEA